MCLAIPGKIIEVKKDKALVDFDGLKKEINISLIDSPQKGDFVIVHTGFAIQKINQKETQKIIKLYEDKKYPTRNKQISSKN